MNGNKSRALRNSKYVTKAKPQYQRRAYRALKKMYNNGFKLNELL